jgi:hypothetical protein
MYNNYTKYLKYLELTNLRLAQGLLVENVVMV